MKIFEGCNEVALTEEDVTAALELFFRYKFVGAHQFKVSNIKHCRSDSRYSLRFNLEET